MTCYLCDNFRTYMDVIKESMRERERERERGRSFDIKKSKSSQKYRKNKLKRYKMWMSN